MSASGDEAGRPVSVANNGDRMPALPQCADSAANEKCADAGGSEKSVSNGAGGRDSVGKATAMTGSAHYMNMPVEPGDIIVVPGGVMSWSPDGFIGQVLPVGSGLTATGCGRLGRWSDVAADPRTRRLMRSDGNGNKVAIPTTWTDRKG